MFFSPYLVLRKESAVSGAMLRRRVEKSMDREEQSGWVRRGVGPITYCVTVELSGQVSVYWMLY